mgnify:FL=1
MIPYGVPPDELQKCGCFFFASILEWGADLTEDQRIRAIAVMEAPAAKRVQK